MSKHPIPNEVMDAWFRPSRVDARVRRDLRTFALSTPSRAALERLLTEGLRTFDRPVLVAWATEDKLMPRDHGPRLAALFEKGRLVEIPDSYTLIPEDQPDRLADELRSFVGDDVARARGVG